ncbi:MAG: hypothetical protein DMF90_27435 [Acidobacteria bacterium]|nr:MAG: hypothetical protein DMF90_27435 [Acidobacteriota bacterium]
MSNVVDPSLVRSLPLHVTSLSRSCEADRIVREYARRASEIPSDFYALDKPANLFIHQQRSRRVLSLLAGIGLLPLRGKRALEVGCGAGGWLPELESWGVRRSDLAGIDLDPGRIETARTFLCARRDETGRVLSHGADIQCGDATSLPWPASRFDLVIVSTVFSSILAGRGRRDPARLEARGRRGLVRLLRRQPPQSERQRRGPTPDSRAVPRV